MPTRDELVALLERVRTATGPDRMLDADIAITLELCPRGSMRMSELRDEAAFATGPYTMWKAPLWSASIDAALALVDRTLPGWDVSLYRADNLHVAEMDWPNGALSEGAAYFPPMASKETRPLAILAALLSALISQHSEARHADA